MSETWLINGTVITGSFRQEHCCVLVRDGKVEDVTSLVRFREHTVLPETAVYDVKESIIAPGLIDTHIHGFGGFGTEDGDPESILRMSELLCDYGVTSFCPTVYTDTEEKMVSSLRSISSAMGKERGARIMGAHMEGPFISPNRAGFQKQQGISSVDLDLMGRLYEAADGKIVNMTVAPELKGMRHLALYCMKKGIVLQAGHTDAKYEHMVEGLQAGILHSTHFFNAMSRLHHRNPGAVGAIMIHPELSCEVIADGEHVHPELIKLILREKPVDRVVLVTDCLKPAGRPDGDNLANSEVVHFENGVFADEIGTLAGSSLTMIKGVKNLVSWRVPEEQAIQMASSNPARIMGFHKKGALIPSYDADIIVMDKQFNVLFTMVEGKETRNLFQ